MNRKENIGRHAVKSANDPTVGGTQQSTTQARSRDGQQGYSAQSIRGARYAQSTVSRTSKQVEHQPATRNASAMGQNERVRPVYAAVASEYSRNAYGSSGGYGDGRKSKKGKHLSRGKKIAIGIVVALIVILGTVGVAAALYVNSINSNLAFDNQQEFDDLQDALAPAEDDNASYALILGSDARSGDTASRSDVIILARLDPADGIAELISIPRDTMVTIPGHGTQKINAAYSYGGAAGAVECVSEFAGVPISHYVEVHFEELKEVVDRLGGVTVTIPEDISAGNGGQSFSAGTQVINGEQALAFARERYNVSGGDFGRAHAQRMILTAIINKVLDAPVTDIPGLVSELSSCISTDYMVADLIDLALEFQSKGLTMYTVACPSYTYSVDGISYVATRFDEWQDIMRRVDANLDPKGKDTIPEPQASDTKLGSATNSPAPRDYAGLVEGALTTDDVAGDE